MPARIYQETKSTTQSGRAREGRWVLEHEAPQAIRHDPVTGWLGSGDTRGQIRLTFPTLEAATAYAERQGIEYAVYRGSGRTLKLQAYADNFR